MRVIVTGRQGGKTTELVRRAAQDPRAVVVVMHENGRLNIESVARKMGVPCPRTMTMDEIASGRHRGMNVRLFVDDAEYYIRQYFGPGAAIETIAVNDDEMLYIPYSTPDDPNPNP